MAGGQLPPQFLADQLTLIKPKENKLEGCSEVLLGPNDDMEFLNHFMNIILKN